MTRIAVCIPTYKRPEELARLLESLPADVHAYVSDNGSALGPEFRARFPRVVFRDTGTPTAPLGMFPNWNRAAAMAEVEDWILVPSDDDIYYPDSFATIAATLAAHPAAGIVVFGHHTVGESYEVLSTWRPEAGIFPAPEGFERFKFGVDARMPSIAIRRALMQRLGGFDEHYVFTASDSDLVQRALLAADAVFVPEVVSGYRVWQHSATHATLPTAGWMTDIDYWGSKLERELRGVPRFAREARRIRDELYATNLLVGLGMLRIRGALAECRTHFRRSRYPFGARPKTQLRILYQVARTFA